MARLLLRSRAFLHDRQALINFVTSDLRPDAFTRPNDPASLACTTDASFLAIGAELVRGIKSYAAIVADLRIAQGQALAAVCAAVVAQPSATNARYDGNQGG